MAGFADSVTVIDKSIATSRAKLLAAVNRSGIVLLNSIPPDAGEQILEMGLILGTGDVGIEEELLGSPVMHLRADPQKRHQNQPPTYYTSDFFPLHTDVSYVPTPPRFILLHCVHPAPDGNGLTLISDCNKAFSSIPDSARIMLRKQIFSFLYPPGCPEGASGACAVFSNGLWRYKPLNMRFPGFASQAVEVFDQALTAHSISLNLQQGDVLIIDNHRIAHGRTAFRPAPVSLPGRHILRHYCNPLPN